MYLLYFGVYTLVHVHAYICRNKIGYLRVSCIAIFVETKSDIAMIFYHDNAQLAFDKINII